ncbi:MAG: TraR/DksA C4-type zinc finger protein, partial [Desulfobacterales bacterium]
MSADICRYIINARAMNGMTPLILASGKGHMKVVEILLRGRADVTAKSNAGSKALTLATERGLQKIRRSLEDIENGEYGIWEDCGEDISIERLKARPVTSFCIRCKTKRESLEKLTGT